MSHVTLIERKVLQGEDKYGYLSVIDGQQRISTNYQAFINDESIRDIVLDITRGYFVDLKGKDTRKIQIPVGILYNKDPNVYTEYIRTNPHLAVFEVNSLLNQVRTKFTNYFYTINYAQDLPGEDQIEWFDVLNLAGSRVPETQMKLTRLQIKGVDFYKEYSNVFTEKLELHGYDLFVQKNTEVSIPLATLNPLLEIILNKEHTSNYSPMASDKKESIIVDLDSSDLRSCFQMTLSGLECALEFLSNNNLPNPSRIDYITYLTGYFVYKNNQVNSAVDEQKLINWYSDVDFDNKSNQARRIIFNELLIL